MLQHKTIPVGSYCVNCSILWQGTDALIVDPGQDADLIVSFLSDRGLAPQAILFTHGHFDHIGGLPGLLAKYPDLPVYAHPSDGPMFGHPMNQMPPEYPCVAKPANLRDIREAPAAFSGFAFQVLETPGHTPGSVCLKFGDLLLSGDTLFAGSCGRTDFPGGSMAAMRRSLAALATLPPETDVIPGHGPTTTIGREVAENPFMER
jgi:glyoxylase-like metal-dependent hydrolase (beta-lactamase superfamily II)